MGKRKSGKSQIFQNVMRPGLKFCKITDFANLAKINEFCKITDFAKLPYYIRGANAVALAHGECPSGTRRTLFPYGKSGASPE